MCNLKTNLKLIKMKLKISIRVLAILTLNFDMQLCLF